MADYKPFYDPPLEGDKSIEELSLRAFNGDDQELILHLGLFIGWYAQVEQLITMLLYEATAQTNPMSFHTLTRGLDARGKILRLKEAAPITGYSVGPNLDSRLDHFSSYHAGLRNKLVHNHLYWPAGGPLQISSLGAPPIFHGDEDLFPEAPKPDLLEGSHFFEMSLWLHLFSMDLGDISNQPHVPRILERDGYRASLPKGHLPRQPGSTRHATKRKPPRKDRPTP